MKGSAIARILLFSLLALVLTGVLISGIAEELYLLDYDAGDGIVATGEVSIAADSIQKLEINWAAGAVNINTGDTDQITFQETASEDSKYQLVYNVNGDTLELNYSNRGGISIGFGNHSIPNKDLTVTVPRDWVCEQIEIDGASLVISIQHLTVEKLDMDGAANSLQFLGSVEQVEVDGASNNIHLNCENHPILIDIDGASCDLDIILPSGCGFAVDMEGLSCDFHSDLDYTTKNGQYIYGNGHTNVSVDGISCDVTISESAECAHDWDLGYPVIEPDSGNQLTVYTCLRCGKTKSEAAPNVESDAYAQAEALLLKGKKAAAALAFAELGSYRDAEERCSAIWAELNRNVTLDGSYILAGIRTDGTVITAGRDLSPYADTKNWTNIRSVSVGPNHILGLRADGTMLAAGDNRSAQCNVSTWTDIISVCAGETFSVGLKANGDVVCAGSLPEGFFRQEEWKDVVMLTASDYHIVGLKRDGTVIATGQNTYGQCDVSGIRNVVHIYADNLRTVLLLADGTLQNIGSDTYALVQTSHPGLVSYGTSTDCHYGVMADGSVVCLQYDENYDLDVTQWQDTVAFTTYAGRLLGLQPDGTFRVLYAFSEAEGLLPDWSGLLVS